MIEKGDQVRFIGPDNEKFPDLKKGELFIVERAHYTAPGALIYVYTADNNVIFYDELEKIGDD